MLHEPQKLVDSGVLVDSRDVPNESCTPDNLADEEWATTISEFLANPSDAARVKERFYDPKLRRYFYRLPSGIKVLTGEIPGEPTVD